MKGPRTQQGMGEKGKGLMQLLLFTMLAAVSAIRAHEPLEDIKEEVIITLQESPETKKSLEERIKEEPKIDFVQVKPIGDDINEINENWQIDGNLFQGDLALTPDEEKSLVKDVEQEVAEMMKSSTEAAH
nr:metalloprotease I [Haemonchus contortus]